MNWNVVLAHQVLQKKPIASKHYYLGDLLWVLVESVHGHCC